MDVAGKTYHADCFVCQRCGQKVSPNPFQIRDVTRQGKMISRIPSFAFNAIKKSTARYVLNVVRRLPSPHPLKP